MSKPTKAAKAADDSTKQPAVSTTTGASTPMPGGDGGTAALGAAGGAAPTDATVLEPVYVACWPLKFAGQKFAPGAEIPPLSPRETASLLKLKAIQLAAEPK